MSKQLPDPQIQSLRAMRSGDIAFGVGSPAVQTIGKQNAATAQPIINLARSLAAAESVGSPVATPNESPVVSRAIATTLSEDVAASAAPVTTNALVTIDGPFNESPVVGVAFSTSVV